jgi:hypothetical protein
MPCRYSLNKKERKKGKKAKPPENTNYHDISLIYFPLRRRKVQ